MELRLEIISILSLAEEEALVNTWNLLCRYCERLFDSSMLLALLLLIRLLLVLAARILLSVGDVTGDVVAERDLILEMILVLMDTADLDLLSVVLLSVVLVVVDEGLDRISTVDAFVPVSFST